ncbi:limonene-1,2-epoxide hydrolase family protein [Patulibacter sp. NPDC049589]|uniref:nuclear transport factor 2 family protein n=1 Tax=Patulibacter sp. NPDC049589 TaxID=3154731 RepID=UPI003421D6DF
MTNPESVVRSYFEAAAKPGNLLAAVDEHFTPDAIWQNTGLPTAEGIEAIKGFWQHFVDQYAMHAMIVEVLALAVAGDRVVTERIDHFDDPAGNRVASVPVAGTFVVRDGRIALWRDYFDPRPFLG